MEFGPEIIKMCCINIHLSINSFTFKVPHMLIILHDCYTLSKLNVVQQSGLLFKFYVYFDVTYTKPFQS